MNLIQSSWIPVRRQSGRTMCIAPFEITDPDDPIVEFAAPRPDFNSSLAQFLIGLFQTAIPPKDEEQWEDWLDDPPSPALLAERFKHYLPALDLFGDHARFMQDFDLTEGESLSVAALLIDSPGGQALRFNTDHFVKRGRVEKLCPACTAMALFTLQTNAPAGGAGNRVSLRGGGPLTTLVLPDPHGGLNSLWLWHTLWLNVLAATDGPAPCDAAVFPWLGPTRTSEAKTGVETTPKDAHPLQAYWGMPRRIRLHAPSNVENGSCDICGVTSEKLVRSYTAKNYGTNYTGDWRHPLTPYHIDNDGQGTPLHPQPGGITYRYWLPIILGRETNKPAKIVSHFMEYRKLADEQLRVWAFGYDMDKMKARCWYETVMPLYLLTGEVRISFAERIQAMINAATIAAQETAKHVKKAFFRRPGDVKGDISFVKETFFQRTETDFFALADNLRQLLLESEDDLEILERWHRIITTAALAIFDLYAASVPMDDADPGRIARSHQELTRIMQRKVRKVLNLSAAKKTQGG